MKLPPFDMERWQSLHEHRTSFNLSDSGVHPYRFDELVELLGADVGSTALGYIQTDGTDGLREAVSGLYPGADESSVLVTSGSAEANFVAVWKLLDPGDRVVVVTPAYAQTDGLARGLGAEVTHLPMEESRGWQPEPGAAARTITAATRLVVITNPGNPTGSLLEESAIDELLQAAEAAGAWILADEVYRGAELDGPMTPTLFGRGDRVVATSSLSKAYGLAGLRIGWLVSPPGFKASVWERKDYTTIASTALSDCLATLALAPEARGLIFERTRGILAANLAVVERWLAGHADVLHGRSPLAGAICFIRYAGGAGSRDMAERLRAEYEVLVVPGEHFGMDGYFRIGFGIPTGELEEALARLSEAIEAGLLEG